VFLFAFLLKLKIWISKKRKSLLAVVNMN
jgi:hypothetical protein